MGGEGDWERGRLGEGEIGREGEIGIEIFTIFEILAAKFNIIMKIMRSHKELDVYQLAFKTSMEIFHISGLFPKEELYSLTSQIRRSSRSVSANLAEAFRKRRYEKAFVAKLSDSEAEAAETQVWIDYSLECGYIPAIEHDLLFKAYENVIGKIVNMINHPDQWSI
jgi:four helix bundle protein